MMRVCGVALACVLASACGLSLSGTGLGPTADADAAADAATASDSALASESGALSACGPDAAGLGANGSMCAPKATTTPVVDANLSDWAEVPFFHLDTATAGYQRTANISADFAVQWTATTLYFAMRVTDPKPQGNDNTNPYNNSAVELYLDGSGAPKGTYQADDHQYVVDYKNFAREYDDGNGRSPPAGFASKTALVTGGYIVEMSIPAAPLGRTSFSPTTMGFDVELDENASGPESGVLIFYEKAAPINCGSCSCGGEQPFCNTYLFGQVNLVQ